QAYRATRETIMERAARCCTLPRCRGTIQGVLPYAAYLRVYEPLIAFPPQDQIRWARYAESRDRPRRARALEVEHDESLRRLLRVPTMPIMARPSPALRWAECRRCTTSWVALFQISSTS